MEKSPHADLEPHHALAAQHMTHHIVYMLQQTRESLNACTRASTLIRAAVFTKRPAPDGGLSGSTESLTSQHRSMSVRLLTIKTVLDEASRGLSISLPHQPSAELSGQQRVMRTLLEMGHRVAALQAALSEAALPPLFKTGLVHSRASDLVESMQQSLRSMEREVEEICKTHADGFTADVLQAFQATESTAAPDGEEAAASLRQHSSDLPVFAEYLAQLQGELLSLQEADIPEAEPTSLERLDVYLDWLGILKTTVEKVSISLREVLRFSAGHPDLQGSEMDALERTLGILKSVMESISSVGAATSRLAYFITSLFCGLISEGFCRPDDDDGEEGGESFLFCVGTHLRYT